MNPTGQAIQALVHASVNAGELNAKQGAMITSILEGGSHHAPEQQDRLLTIEKFAKRCSASRATVFRMIKRGKIKRVLLSARSARIPESELEKLISGDAQ